MARRVKTIRPFEFVSEVTEEHATAFVDELYRRQVESGALDEALSAAGIMGWPDAPKGHKGINATPGQAAFLMTQDEIAKRIQAAARSALMTAFQDATIQVLRIAPKGAARHAVERA